MTTKLVKYSIIQINTGFYLSVCLCRFNSETADSIEMEFVGIFHLFQGWFQAKHFSDLSTSQPEKPVFMHIYLYTTKIGCLSICKTTKPVELIFLGNLPLGLGMIMAKEFPDSSISVRCKSGKKRFLQYQYIYITSSFVAANPIASGFYSNLYITLYFIRNRISSVCVTAKSIELKFCGKFPLGPGLVLG